MLNLRKHQIFLRWTAEVFMCEKRTTGNGVIYWNLRLLRQGSLIDAFHWDHHEHPRLLYRPNESVTVFGRWTTPQKTRLQILWSTAVNMEAANDDQYDSDSQSTDTSDVAKRKKVTINESRYRS